MAKIYVDRKIGITGGKNLSKKSRCASIRKMGILKHLNFVHQDSLWLIAYF